MFMARNGHLTYFEGAIEAFTFDILPSRLDFGQLVARTIPSSAERIVHMVLVEFDDVHGAIVVTTAEIEFGGCQRWVAEGHGLILGRCRRASGAEPNDSELIIVVL
jgi:hypothetical protein